MFNMMAYPGIRRDDSTLDGSTRVEDERYVTHREGSGAGLVVDCPGAMPFVRGIVGEVVYRDATIRRRIELCAATPS